MKLLIIEDSERLRRSLTTGLVQCGYTVESTGDGLLGMRLALSYEFDLILLDIMLPSLDGFSLLQQLRDQRKNTNVLIISAKDEVDNRIKGLNLGADDYLCKPFAFDELLARMQSILRRTHQHKSASIHIDTVRVDTALRQVFIADKELGLTPYEYKILERMALNQNRVISSDALLDYLYQSDASVTRNAIEAHISTLRKKLKLAGVDDLIKTRRGFGYCIEKP